MVVADLSVLSVNVRVAALVRKACTVVVAESAVVTVHGSAVTGFMSVGQTVAAPSAAAEALAVAAAVRI